MSGERDLEWARRFKAGDAAASIAKEYGVSRQRVYQVLKKLGVSPPLKTPDTDAGLEIEREPTYLEKRLWSVYVMAAPLDGGVFLKVGISSDIVKRLDAVQTGCPIRITDIWAINAFSYRIALWVESSMHKALEKYRTTGEWFRAEIENPEHKLDINAAFSFAVSACSEVRPVKWRAIRVPDLKAAVRAEHIERMERTREKDATRAAFDFIHPMRFREVIRG